MFPLHGFVYPNESIRRLALEWDRRMELLFHYVFLNIDLEKSSIEMEPIIIESAEDLCEELLYEISNDVMENTSHEFTLAEAPLDIRLEIESRFSVYLDQLPQYRHLANDMFKAKS